MSKRNTSTINEKSPSCKKIRLSLDMSLDNSIDMTKNEDHGKLDDVPDFTGINRDEIESTIYQAIQKNNISNAKAKYLIRKMLKHPHVVEWFRNIFNSDTPKFNLLYEPRITRSSKRKVKDGEDSCFSSLDANLIGRLLLSAPTINSFEFDNEDNNDNDYSPESENSGDSDQSSLISEMGHNKVEQVILSPYCTRSRATLNDLQVDLVDDSLLGFEDDDLQKGEPIIHESLTLEEMHNLMDVDVDDQRYEEFKKSLYMDDFKLEEPEDDPEFDVLAQIDDLDEDIFDDFRDDRTVKIPRSELWGLLKDNNLVKGNGSTSTNKKTITMLCEDDEIGYSEPCSDIKEKLVQMKFTPEQRERLSRQIIMFYQQLATIFIMVYDQQHLRSITDAQVSYYFRIISNISQQSDESFRKSIFNPTNRSVIEKILFNYKGISYIPTSRFNNSLPFKKIDFPKCIMATLLCSSAFPYVQLLPSSFKLYNHTLLVYFRQIPFLPSEDKLLTMGIIQFSHQCHKMLKLIKKYLFPIRSTDQLRNRKTNIIRRHKELNHRESEMISELLQFSGYSQVNKKNLIKVHSDLAKLPVHVTPIWQRKEEWKLLSDIYKSFLTKTVPNIMYNLHLCTKEEWSRANRIATNRKNNPTREFQFCNWSSLPWELEKVDFVRKENKKNYVKTTLRKVVNKKSFPQYEVPKNSHLREFLRKWNCNYENQLTAVRNSNKIQLQKRKLNFLKKSVKRAKRFFLKWNSKKEQKQLKTEQSYAHYFRNDNIANLFPHAVFKSRLDEYISTKDLKNPRLQRFQTKCREKESDIIDFTSLSFSNKDEVDLLFSRNLLSSLRNNLDTEAYEQCLDKINEFQFKENDSNCDQSEMELIKFLMNIAKADSKNVNIYEDLLSLLTLQQAIKLGCEIDWCRIRNVNQLYNAIKSLNIIHQRRFWPRLSTLIHKSKEGIFSLGKVIQYLHASVKNNIYLQSLIPPLLNCWETPFPNYPQAFANFDSLSSNSNLAEFSKESEKDAWEYCTDLMEQPKNTCTCSCHDNSLAINAKESPNIRHCSNCNLKVYNGCIYMDDSKIHKRLIMINSPAISKPVLAKKDFFNEDYTRITNPKPDSTTSMSVVDFLKSKSSTSTKQFQNRCITIKETQNQEVFQQLPDDPNHSHWMLFSSGNPLPYMQVLEDGEAAMDADVFRQIKGRQLSNEVEHETNLQIPKFEGTVKHDSNGGTATTGPQNWSDDDNLLLLKLCQNHGPTNSTFVYLQGAHFPDRSLGQIEDQFNYLFQQVLEYQQQA